jgi:hypothetical protein
LTAKIASFRCTAHFYSQPGYIFHLRFSAYLFDYAFEKRFAAVFIFNLLYVRLVTYFSDYLRHGLLGNNEMLSPFCFRMWIEYIVKSNTSYYAFFFIVF